MAEHTGIEWTDTTWSCITGCERCSPGCAHCYAEVLTATRLKEQPKYKGLAIITASGEPHWTGDIRLHPDELLTPLRWRKPRKVFVNSMSDTFHHDVPESFLDQMFASMALAGQHIFQVLTKRALRMRAYLSGHGVQDRVYEAMELLAEKVGIADFLFDAWPLPNVWIGASVEDQQRADERIPWLCQTPAAVRFLSCEPLLGPVDLNFACEPRQSDGSLERGRYLKGVNALRESGIHWVIIGGESGRDARPCHVDWILDLVRQCQAAGVACFVKQLGGYVFAKGGDQITIRLKFRDSKGGDPSEWPEDLRVREFPA